MQIDFNKKRIREGYFTKGWSIAKWKELPKHIDYISIIQVKMRGKNSGGFISTIPDTETIYKELQINLIYEKRKRYLIHSASTVEASLKIAKKIGKNLKLDILVSTTEKKYWIRHI